MLDGLPGLAPQNQKPKPSRKGWLIGVFILIPVLAAGFIWLSINNSGPREAPEAARILGAQVQMPFQILIPAYMPKLFDRENVEIIADQPGPRGETMIKLVYSTRKGDSLTLSEWIPSDEVSGQESSNGMSCFCICRTGQQSDGDVSPWRHVGDTSQCNIVGMELNVGSVRVRVEFSTPNLLYYDEFQFMLNTLGPAANRQVYSAIEDVPLSFSVPPPVEIPIGADGVQEVNLIVSPQGYSPVHFSVKKDVPVRLIFRQLGQVGCGNELIFQVSSRKSATLTLAYESDKKVLEFTPGEVGEFRFNCPHLIYRGVMTVTE